MKRGLRKKIRKEAAHSNRNAKEGSKYSEQHTHTQSDRSTIASNNLRLFSYDASTVCPSIAYGSPSGCILLLIISAPLAHGMEQNSSATRSASPIRGAVGYCFTACNHRLEMQFFAMQSSVANDQHHLLLLLHCQLSDIGSLDGRNHQAACREIRNL